MRWSQLSYRRRAAIKAEVYAVKGTDCQIRLRRCTGVATTVDHVIPDEDGGPHTVENLEPACASCNQLRGASGMPYTTGKRSDVGASAAW